MSGGRFSIIPAHAIDDIRLAGAALKVLAALGCYGSKSGWCFPSQGEIARRLGISRQGVQKQIRILEQLGYIEVKAIHRRNGSRSSNNYRIVFDRELKVMFDREAAVRGLQPQVAGGHPEVAQVQPQEVAGPATSRGCSNNDQSERSIERSTTLSASADGAFEKFWNAYPRKTAKRKAREAFRKLNPDGTLLDSLIRSIEAHKATDQWRRDVIPHAANWLAQRRWEDDLDVARWPVRPRLCEDIVALGQVCGMPAMLRGGGALRCDAHERQRQDRSHAPMPAEARAALQKLLVRRRAAS